jgi:hypothetical protein
MRRCSSPVSRTRMWVRAGRRALIERGMAMGGRRAATELFLRSVAGDETYERMDADLRERLLGTGPGIRVLATSDRGLGSFACRIVIVWPDPIRT